MPKLGSTNINKMYLGATQINKAYLGSTVIFGEGGGGGGTIENDILVESFDTDIGASGSTYTLTNNVGATSSAFVRKITSTDKATGPVGNTGNAGPNIAHAGVALTGADELTFYKGNSTTQKIVGEVWRYTGDAGGVNEFINRGDYAVTISSGSSSATQAVTGLVNRNDAVPILNGLSTTITSTSDYEETTVAVHINSSGEIVVSRNNNTNGTLVVYVTVVEFTGSNWSIGHGFSGSHDSSIQTVTLNTDSTGAGGSTFDVGDWGTAMIIDASMEGDTSETGLADVMALIQPAGTTTQVTFSVTEADAAARNDGDGYIHVIQNDDLIVDRATNTNLSEGNNTYTTNAAWPSGASTISDLDKLSMEWFVSTSGTGTAHARGRLTARITAASGTIQNWVHRSGNNIRAYYGVVDLSNLTSTHST